ncbi:MAG: exo-alpha-sialidase [Fimbriimonadaceae bacterium]|nr:exo-alpha-sialidase [Fimbriimonadaceae bacterium]
MNTVLPALLLAITAGAPLTWDRESLVLIHRGGLYGRLARLPEGELLAVFEAGGRCWLRRSSSSGRTWSDAALLAEFAAGTAANPELTVLRDGVLLCSYNERPRDGVHPFAIVARRSLDGGQTWQAAQRLYEAGTDADDGCWEPAAAQLPDGRVVLLFANEQPYHHSQEQEISGLVSHDAGATWEPPRQVLYRPGGRDGMPVPRVLADGRLAVAFEDNGTGALQPALALLAPPFAQPVRGDDPLRWPAITPALPPDRYAGAPYLAVLADGRTILSCQQAEADGVVRLTVYCGDASGRSFGAASQPFAALTRAPQRWNSVFAKAPGLVTVVSSTTLDGVAGLWAMDGRLPAE